MRTDKKLEKLNATNPQLVREIFQDPTVNLEQKMFEKATTAMEKNLKRTKEPQSKKSKFKQMK